jgi:hypothetical protein
MSREPSYFENSGMPVLAPSAGRVRHAHEPWLGSFSTRPAQAAERQPGSMPAASAPEAAEEIVAAYAENGQSQPGTRVADAPTASTQINELPAAPSLLQRATASSTAVQSGGATPSGVQAGFAANRAETPHAAIGSALTPSLLPDRPPVPVANPHLMPASDGAMNAAGGSESFITSPIGIAGAPPKEAEGAAVSMPKVLVQKHITIQTEVSAMAGGEGVAAFSPAANAAGPFFAAVNSPLPMMTAADTASLFLPQEDFAATPAMPQTASARPGAARMEMGANDISGMPAMPQAMPTGQPRNEVSQQALLERLSYRPAPRQEAGGRRVHIGNLHITVQRPAMAAAAPPSSVSSAPAQPAAAPQTFFNPWERHNPAFD